MGLSGIVKNQLLVLGCLLGLAWGLSGVAVAADVPEVFEKAELSEAEIDAVIAGFLEHAAVPPVEHPRLYGSNADWSAGLARWDELDLAGAFEGGTGRGEVKNVAGLWWQASMGYNPYNGKSVGSFETNTLTKEYFEGVSSRERLRTLHLIRRLDVWFAEHEGEHELGSREAFEDFKERFVSVEMAKLRAEPRNGYGFISSWHKGYSGAFFDLGSEPAFEFWCLFLDVFWDEPEVLSDADQAYVTQELSVEIDDYMRSYEEGYWNLFNGNNWTMVLNAAAVYWAITFYHEDARAPEVLRMVLETNWLHRGFFLEDGGYLEGVSYTGVSFGPAHKINRLFLTAFGQPMYSYPWSRMPDTAQWLVDNVLSDGLFADFGDSWARRGFTGMDPLMMKLWKEVVGLEPYGSVDIDACFVNDYFGRSYYDHMFSDTLWSLDPCMARDWYSLVETCERGERSGVALNFYGDYKEAVFQVNLPGSNPFVEDTQGLFTLAETTTLAVNATPNGFPHREIDSGGVLWSAYGSRLLWDYGYGEIAKNGHHYDFYEVQPTKGRYVPESEADALEMYLKVVEGEPDWAELNAQIKVRYNTYQVPVADYIEESVAGGWFRVSIPLADFGVPDSRWLEGAGEEAWNGAGIINVGFKIDGGFEQSSVFGLDEVRLVNAANPEGSLLWYGDEHRDSAQPGAVSSSKALYVYVEAEETSGGALTDGSWMRIHQGSVGVSLSFEYNDAEGERYVVNRIDNVPMGTNSLVVEGRYEEHALRGVLINTNMSQLKGEVADMRTLILDGRQVVELDQGRLYGAEDPTGCMDYYKRWICGLEDGNFLIVDAFRLKEGVEGPAREFWWVKQDPVNAGCAHGAFSDTVDAVLTDAHTLSLSPRCWQIAWDGEAHTRGRMLAASLEDGAFVEGAPEFMSEDPYYSRFVTDDGVVLRNRLGASEVRKLFRYEADAFVREDVRAFLLVAAPTEELMPVDVSLEMVPGEGDALAFQYSLDGNEGAVYLERNEAGEYAWVAETVTYLDTLVELSAFATVPGDAPLMTQTVGLGMLSAESVFQMEFSNDLIDWTIWDDADVSWSSVKDAETQSVSVSFPLIDSVEALFYRVRVSDDSQ